MYIVTSVKNIFLIIFIIKATPKTPSDVIESTFTVIFLSCPYPTK